ncbi:MAG TPA: hypothetical protein VJ464_17650 [Blastocatellia bacterium]|nr:hypothetical protein [Blastocatellia bacterium]
MNLFEAEQLARIKPGRLDLSLAAARRKRAEILSAHLRSRASSERLRRRVNEMLVPPKLAAVPLVSATDTVAGYEPLEDFDPYDSTHLFWEEIKQLGFAFRDIRRDDLTDELIEELLRAAQPVWAVLTKIQRRKQVETIKVNI